LRVRARRERQTKSGCEKNAAHYLPHLTSTHRRGDEFDHGALGIRMRRDPDIADDRTKSRRSINAS
jgi:hypothetical protein